jgi:hypothetical protein
MNSNGQNRNNTFAGDVYVNGDLTVSGTINGGGGGGGDVTNPMTSDLNAGNYAIFNISEITAGEEGYIKTGPLDLQDNDIINVNELKGRSDDNKLYISGNVEMTEDLNMTDKNINNVGTLDTNIITSSNSTISFNSKGISNLIFIGSPNAGADNIVLNGNIVSNNGNSLDGITSITGYGSGDVLYINGDIRISNSLNLLGNNITAINNTETKGISSSTGSTAFTSILNMFNDINMNNNDIFNVERITTSHAGVSINLDLVPATEGKAGQVLARDPSFDPLNFNTHKLVWANQSAGGGVTNPMTANLQAAQYSILDAQTLESKNINIITGGSGLACANGSFAVPITWGLAQKLSLAPFYQTFNTDYITPATNLGIVIDSKAPDGITDSKITLSAPTININNSTNLAPSNINITGNLQITNSSGYIHGNNLIVRGRNASAVPTPITIEGTTTSINSSTLNITSSTSNNFLGAVNTNFSGTVRTNTIDANSGGTISVLQNLTLATGRQLRTDLLFSDGLRSYTTDLILTGLLPDNKTQTNILLASPQITLNNQFGPLVPETQVNIAGGIVFNNPVSNPFIHGPNLSIRGRTPAGVATPLTLESTTTTINSSTLTIFSTLNNNIGGPTNFDRNINLLSARGININPSMILYRTYGPPSAIFNITDGLTYVKVTDGQTAKGSKIIPLNGLVVNDIYKLTLKGLLSTSTVGNMEFNIYFGVNRACTISFINTAMANEGFEFSCQLTVRDVGGGTLAVDIGMGKLERNNFTTRITIATSGANMSNPAGSLDIFMKPSVNIATGTVTIYNYTIENI